MREVPGRALRAYVILDDQSSHTLVDRRVLDHFKVKFPKRIVKINHADEGSSSTIDGQLVTGLQVQGVLASEVVDIPTAFSCHRITDTRGLVTTPVVARAHAHVAHLADYFPPYDSNAEVLMLIGRNCVKAMKSVLLSDSSPYLYQTPLGLALVGSGCQNNETNNINCNVFQTSIQPIINHPVSLQYGFETVPPGDTRWDIYKTHPDDEEPGLSTEDRIFLSKLTAGVCTSKDGRLELPLPVRDDHIGLPDNSCAVYGRTLGTVRQIFKDPVKVSQCTESIQKSLDKGYIEEVPPDERVPKNGECWYLPIFPVSHAHKEKLRLVFDAAARYKGICLNDILLQGPDLNNQLRGVLTRFRQHPIAIGADVEAMFNNFMVPKHQQDLLRFYWFQGNDPSCPLVPFRSKSHLFGCTSSPAVANFALKYCALDLQSEEFEAAVRYILCSFYVDDGLYSSDSIESAINILEKSIKLLKRYKIRLHKIISNNKQVLSNFPPSECAVNITEMDLQQASLHRTLGVAWNISDDTFRVKVSIPEREFTQRGILSVINSLYDPLGFVSPVILLGRLIQREIIPCKNTDSEMVSYDWDDLLPEKFLAPWQNWVTSLVDLTKIRVPRSFYPMHFKLERQELHVFCDASDNAIGHVLYIRSVSQNHQVHVSFISSSSKVAPRCATSTPRLELCAAVEAARSVRATTMELERKPDDIYLYSDSKVVLGYLINEQRRFTKYVARRVAMALKHVPIDNWCYVATDQNPADYASRPNTPTALMSSFWYKGPEFLWSPEYKPITYKSLPKGESELPETIQEAVIMTSIRVKSNSVLHNLFDQRNDLNLFIKVSKVVIQWARLGRRKTVPLVTHHYSDVDRDSAMKLLVKAAQAECFKNTIEVLQERGRIPDHNKLSELSPVLDEEGTLRVGGRLKHANIPFSVKHPALIPRFHPLSEAIVHHYHREVKHQGEIISHSRIRQAGYHIEKGRTLVREIIRSCRLCRQLRARLSTQLMADLPRVRLEEAPPFENTGMDVFGPYHLCTGKRTRRSTATKKIWAIIFVCLPSRAIHLEPLFGLDTTSFMLALFRFIALRGTCKTIRCDQGTNFIGGRNQLAELDHSRISRELELHNITWHLNPAHASHFGGVWEAKIGSVRRVLNAAMLLSPNKGLTHDEFITMLAEAASVVNNTPLWALSDDPNDPLPLSPAMILTLRERPNPPLVVDISESDSNAYGQRRYRRTQYLAEQFWKRWRMEYLHTLTCRHKWKSKQRCITPGDLVLIRDKNLQRNKWPTGRVMQVKYSDDGLVRSVKLITPTPDGVSAPRPHTRPITDLVLLVPSPGKPSP